MDLATADGYCRFCEVTARETVITESEHATAFPSLGALVEGWVLVSPRDHVVALSELTDDRWHDTSNLAEDLNRRVRAVYGPTVMFEHGAAGTNRTAGCGVDHAHLHIVPWNGNLREEVAAVSTLPSFSWRPAAKRPQSRPGEDYIWLADRTGMWIAHAAEVPSQVVRQAVANALNLTWWDWKQDLCTGRADATHRRLSALT